MVDQYSRYTTISGTLRNQLCDLELVTTLTLADGSTQEITHTRRAVCKKATRRRNVTTLTFADIDRAALDKPFPFDTFTIADFPDLFIDHVGRRVPQGVGTVVKVPMAWVKNTGNIWRYAGPKSTGTNTLLAVYRGSDTGKGQLVPAVEYTVGTAVGASTGLAVDVINFTREQIDFQGRPYIIEADYLLSGTRTPSAEIQRLLGLYGISVNASAFSAASIADTSAGFFVDACYGGDVNGRTGKAIIEDLLRVARGWISQTATAEWTIVKDIAKLPSAEFDTAADLMEAEEYGDGDIPKTISISYRPASSNREDYTNTLSRTTVGQTGHMEIKNPYIRDHDVADKINCYWQNRLNSLRLSKASLHSVQVANGDVISITDNVAWAGKKNFIVTGITRPADKNEVILREYDASVYIYTPGTLPTNATNVYQIDYTYTPPAAPTGLAIISSATDIDDSGKAFSAVSFRAVPATVNFAELWARITNTVTGEITPAARLDLVSGVYRTTIGRLQPATLHTITVWARNSAGLDGTVATLAHTPGAYAGAPTAPATPSAPVQLVGKSVEVNIAAPTYPNHLRVEWRRLAVISSTYSTITGASGPRLVDTTGLYYANSGFRYSARLFDTSGNFSAWSPDSADIVLAQNIEDGHIVGGGVNAGSIGNSSINRSRSNTFTSSASITGIPVDGGWFQALGLYAFAPYVEADSSKVYLTAKNSAIGGTDDGVVNVLNKDTVARKAAVIWRNFST